MALTPIVLLALLAVNMLVYYANSARVIKADIFARLTESAAQQLALFRTKLDGNMSQLTVLAESLGESDEPLEESGETLRALERVREACGFSGLHIINARDGLLHGVNGVFDVSSRAYYQRALAGETSVDWVESGASDGEPRFLLSAPISRGGEVVAVLNAHYDSHEFAELMVSEVFERASYSHVVNAEGNIIVASLHEGYLGETNNVLDLLRSAKIEDGATVEDIARDLAEGRGGSIAYNYRGFERYAAYLPVGVGDWSIFCVTLEAAIIEKTQASSSPVVQLQIRLLVIFAIFLLFLMVQENKNRIAMRADQEIIRLREEEARIALAQSHLASYRYDVKHKRTQRAPGLEDGFDYPEIIENVPESLIADGLVARESVADYRDFYRRIEAGEPSITAHIRLNMPDGSLRWFRHDATTLFDDAGAPRYAIVSYGDATDQREKELAYEKWRQTINALPLDDMALFEENLSQDKTEHAEGALLGHLGSEMPEGIDARARWMAERCVQEEDKQGFVEFLKHERLLARYYQGQTQFDLEFRMRDRFGEYRWTSVSVQLVPHPEGQDVRAYVLFQNIDAAKRRELAIAEQAEHDALTGALNRAPFTERVEAILRESEGMSRNALIFIDLDYFKQINDNYGHAVGDEVLAEVTRGINTVLRRSDLLSRFGGDEFMVCLRDIPYDAVIEKRVSQISRLLRRRLTNGAQLSGSLGVAVYPRDGLTFEELFLAADTALYYAKEHGRDGYAFYRPDMTRRAIPALTPFEGAPLPEPISWSRREDEQTLRRMRTILIVDDEAMNREMLSEMFQEDFRILTAEDGAQALRLMRRYGAGISVVLLDIFMPDMDGFALLRRRRTEPKVADIPVIVVSVASEREATLEAISLGASDFVPKPVDADMLRLRVMSAIERAEQERIRVQNSYLLFQREEEERYRQVVAHTGTVVFEYDWVNQVYQYDPLAALYIAGKYDMRPLWQILLDDEVATEADMRAMRAFVDGIADDPERASGRMEIRLRTPSGETRWFVMNAIKRSDEHDAPNRMLITFNDIHKEVMAREKKG